MIKKTVFFFLFLVGSGISSEVPEFPVFQVPTEDREIIDQIFTFSLKEDEDRLIDHFLAIQNNVVGRALLERLGALFPKYKEKDRIDPQIYVSIGDRTAFSSSSTSGSPPNFNALVNARPEIVDINNALEGAMDDVDKWELLIKKRENLKSKIINEMCQESEKYKNRDLNLQINPDDTVPVACAGGSVFKAGDHEVVSIGSCPPDLGAMIVHELIHMKHYLEEAVGETVSDSTFDLMPISQAKKITKCTSPGLDSLPEALESRTGTPWTDFEERRTVCGPDKNGITELVYRASARLPNRHFYISGNVSFYDLFTTYKSVVDTAIEQWNQKHADQEITIDPTSFWPSMDRGSSSSKFIFNAKGLNCSYIPKVIKSASIDQPPFGYLNWDRERRVFVEPTP